MDKAEVTDELKNASRELGFELVGACPAVTPSGYHRFLQWLDLGYSGEMRYLPDRVDAYKHPESVMAGVKSILALGMNYHTQARQPPQPGEGSIASYAWGEVDYHDLIRDRLKELRGRLSQIAPQARARGVVDTAPLLEREFGQLAGLGWLGKNTLLLNKELGSYFFLAVLLMDVELKYDDAFEADHCGSCTACLEACPTDAFPQPYVLDARRCISYLTIEHRGEIAEGLRGQWDDWLFGCDICQEVCPWNNRVPESREQQFEPTLNQNPIQLAALFFLDEEQFRVRFRRTPLWRSKRRGVLRNAALVLGAQRDRSALPALRRGSADEEELVRNASDWAIARIGETQGT